MAMYCCHGDNVVISMVHLLDAVQLCSKLAGQKGKKNKEVFLTR